MKKAIPGVPYNPTDPNTWIHVEKETDVNIASDMLVKGYNNAFDTAVLVSADTDYLKVLKDLRRIGKIVEVAVTPTQQSQAVRASADSVISLTEDFLARCE